MSRSPLVVLALLALAVAAPSVGALPPAAPPAVPTASDHPGAASYAYTDVDTTRFVKKPPGFFSPGFLTTVLTPRGAVGKLPVVAFAHGKFLYYDPDLYAKLLTHLCKKGCVVVDVEYEGFLAGALSVSGTLKWLSQFIDARSTIQLVSLAALPGLLVVLVLAAVLLAKRKWQRA